MHAAIAIGVEWGAVRDSRLMHLGLDAHGAATDRALLELESGAGTRRAAVVIKRLTVLRRTSVGWPELVPWPEWAFHLSAAATHRTGGLRPRRCLNVATTSPGQVALFLEDTSAEGKTWTGDALYGLSRQLAIWSATLGLHGCYNTQWLDPDAFGGFSGPVAIDGLEDVVPARLLGNVHTAIGAIQANLACVRGTPSIVGPTAVSLDNVRLETEASGPSAAIVGDWHHFGAARIGCIPAALVASAIVRTDLAVDVLNQCEEAALCGYAEGLKESDQGASLDEVLVGYRAASSLRLVRRAAYVAHMRKVATGATDELAGIKMKSLRFLTLLARQ
jgi:hypothetical protein